MTKMMRRSDNNTAMKRETWLPAAPASAGNARAIVRHAAAEAGLDGEATWDLMLATTEAVANAVQHGEPWPNACILLTTEARERGLRVEVCDCGIFDSALEPTPLEATSGRGIPIIAAIVDRIEVRDGDGRTRVCFEKHTPRTSARDRGAHPTGDRRRTTAAPGSCR
jgi:anti-sigma regulatory factor (Ser/Thr protein kinase)